MIFACVATPEATGANAQTGAAASEDCITREIPLDEGYGVAWIKTRVVCAAGQKK